MGVAHSNPTDKAFDFWSRFITKYYSAELSTLMADNGDSEDCFALNVSLSALQSNNPELFDRVVSSPVTELEIGEFVLQKMVESEGGMFEINLRFDDLPPEFYKKPEEMCSRDVGSLFWFDAVPTYLGNLKPWFKKAAWQCEECSRITLNEIGRGGYESNSPPEVCKIKDGGCGRVTRDYLFAGDYSSEKLTRFTFTPQYGTLLDIRRLHLSDASTLSQTFLDSFETPPYIEAVAVGAIARELNTKSPKRITGKLGVKDSDFEFEIIGCSEVPIERMDEIHADGGDR